MRHFVAYHSEDRMGYPAEECEPFSLYTKKKLSDLKGDTVWVIAGDKHSPKRYFLSSKFQISSVTKVPDSDFEFELKGTMGTVFKPMPRLDQLPWFRQKMANFSIGLTVLSDPAIIVEFERVAAESGRP